MKVTLKDQVIFTGDVAAYEEAKHLLVKELGVLDGDFELSYSPSELKALARKEIEQKAGDSASLLGTTSDATQLLLYGFCQLVAALHKADSLADVRKAAQPYSELAAGFLGKVESGEVKLPFMGKGLEKVVGEIEQRATSVAEVLAQAQANSTNAKQEDQS